MRNYKSSRFTKTIGITENDYKFIDRTKGKKSKAGRLEDVIKVARNAKNSSNNAVLKQV